MTHKGKWDPYYKVPKLFSVLIKKIMWAKKKSSNGSPIFHDFSLLFPTRLKSEMLPQNSKVNVELHGWVL